MQHTPLDNLKMKVAMSSDLAFYASVMYSLDIREGESPHGTAHTSGTEIVFDPSYLAGLKQEKQLSLLLHEIRHVTDMHILRKGDRNPEQWNTACDYVIDKDLASCGYKVPDCMVDQMKQAGKYPEGESAEEVYEWLLEDNSGDSPPRPDLMPPESGEDGGEGESGDGDSGSGMSPEQAQELEGDIKDILIQAVKMAEQAGEKAIGNVPVDIAVQVHEWLNPTAPWDVILQRFMNAFAKEDYSWKRPNRRHLAHGLYTPSLHSEHMGAINIYVDLSYSVTDDQLDMQIGQFRYIHRNLAPEELRICSFDTRISKEFLFKPNEPVNIEFHGRGGTCIRDVVRHMEDNPAEVNLVFSDGYFNHVDTSKVDSEIIWAIYDNPSFTYNNDKVVHIDVG